jgi:hypothetical protein
MSSRRDTSAIVIEPRRRAPSRIRAVERQLGLFSEDAIDAALLRLGPHAARVALAYVETRRQIYAWRTEPATGVVRLRVHRAFRSAPDEVADALVALVLRRPRQPARRALAHRVNAWFVAATGGVPSAARRAPAPDAAAGAFVDLRPPFESMRAVRLPPDFEADLAWSVRPARSLLGRFERGHPRGRIVVNVLLDSPLTPAWYLDFLLYHEALHGVHPPRPGRGRMIVHPPEFRRAERLHPDMARVKDFERWATGIGRRVLAARRDDRKLLPAALR